MYVCNMYDMIIGVSLKLSYVVIMFKFMIWLNIMNDRFSDCNNFGLIFLVLYKYVLILINIMFLKLKFEIRLMFDGVIVK